MSNALVLYALIFLSIQTVFQIGLVALFDTHPGCPFGLEVRKDAANLVEVRAIAALIGTGTFGDFDLTVRNSFLDELSQITHLVVLFVATDVYGKIVNDLTIGLQAADRRLGYVLDMNQGPPGSAVAFQ